ncbi:VOC family protein [Nostoc sp.]
MGFLQQYDTGPEKLGHVAMYVHDVHKYVDFYQNMLGFRVSD